MEERLSMCDYINHVTFMHIEEKENYYIVLMKSLTGFDDKTQRQSFFTLNSQPINAYKYKVLFNKYGNSEAILQTDKTNDIPANN